MKKVKEIYYIENKKERASDYSTGFVFVLEDGSKVETMSTDVIADKYTKAETESFNLLTQMNNSNIERIVEEFEDTEYITGKKPNQNSDWLRTTLLQFQEETMQKMSSHSCKAGIFGKCEICIHVENLSNSND